jgi:hypothetical protein
MLKLRSKKPGLVKILLLCFGVVRAESYRKIENIPFTMFQHCAILCLVAFGLWLLGRHVDPVILWSIVIAALSLPLPLKMSNKMRDGMSYVVDYVSHRGKRKCLN